MHMAEEKGGDKGCIKIDSQKLPYDAFVYIALAKIYSCCEHTWLKALEM